MATRHLLAGLTRSRQVHPDLKEDYFQYIDSKEKAYWLGFLYADGSIRDNGLGVLRLQIGLSYKDEDQLDRFIVSVGANPDKKRRRPNNHGRMAVWLEVGNRIFVAHLVKQGCGLKKTFTIQFPCFQNEQLELAFTLGYFDGDGCLDKYGYALMSSGSRSFLETVRDRHNLHASVSQILGKRCYSLYLGKAFHHKMITNYEFSMPRKRARVAKHFRDHPSPPDSGSRPL